MKLQKIISCIVLLILPMAGNAKSNPVISKGVHIAVEPPKQVGSLFHWKIKNSLNRAVFVYDFYLWGPAMQVNTYADRVVFETAPKLEVRSCPPNRFPPVLLLAVGPGRTIEGDFVDSEVKSLEGKQVSLQIAVGMEPYSVVREAKSFYNSNCEHNPYNAIVRWGTLIESAPAQLRASK